MPPSQPVPNGPPNRPTNHHPITLHRPGRMHEARGGGGFTPALPASSRNTVGGTGAPPKRREEPRKRIERAGWRGQQAAPQTREMNCPSMHRLYSTLTDGQNDGDRAGGSASRPPGPANDMKEDTSTIMHTTHNSSGGELPPCEQWCEPGGCEPFLQETTPSNRKPGGCEPSMPEGISEER